MKPVTYSVFRNQFREDLRYYIEDKLGIQSKVSDLLDSKKVDNFAKEKYQYYVEDFEVAEPDYKEFIEQLIEDYM